MIFAILKDNETKEIEAGVYDCWRDYQKDTFSPTIETLFLTDFKISGKNYQQRKGNAIDLAIDLQHNLSNVSISYGELATINCEMERIAKSYGLIKEFKENAII